MYFYTSDTYYSTRRAPHEIRAFSPGDPCGGDQSNGPSWSARRATERRGDIRPAASPQQRDGEGLAGREGLRRRPTAQVAAVFIERDIGHVVGAVLDAPVPVDRAQQHGRVGAFRRRAGDRGAGFVLRPHDLPLAHLLSPPLEPADLGQVRSAQVGLHRGISRRPQAAFLQPPVPGFRRVLHHRAEPPAALDQFTHQPVWGAGGYRPSGLAAHQRGKSYRDTFAQRRLVRIHRPDVRPAPSNDLRADGALRQQGVAGDQPPRD
jgi:hypothetical protein